MSDVDRTIEAVWKIESTRLIAAIARVTRDIGIAEELAQDAMVAALERWPEEGIPENPAAWLMTAAKRRAIDSLRRGQMLVQKHEEIARELQIQQRKLGEAMDRALDQVIDDDVLRHLYSVPSGASCGRMRGAYFARNRRTDYGGDRACLPCARENNGTADISRQENSLGGSCAF